MLHVQRVRHHDVEFDFGPSFPEAGKAGCVERRLYLKEPIAPCTDGPVAVEPSQFIASRLASGNGDSVGSIGPEDGADGLLNRAALTDGSVDRLDHGGRLRLSGGCWRVHWRVARSCGVSRVASQPQTSIHTSGHRNTIVPAFSQVHAGQSPLHASISQKAIGSANVAAISIRRLVIMSPLCTEHYQAQSG